tara:strand:+ start:1240 stop:1899 length:660 start_codon:yes stop_codon:yes gene_type:complete
MIKNIIFDFDGVLVDSEILARKAFSRYLIEKNINLTENDFSRNYSGNKLTEVIVLLSKRFNIKNQDIFFQEIMELAQKIYKEELTTVKGVKSFLEKIDCNKLIGSNRGKKSIIEGLMKVNLMNFFDNSNIFSFDMVSKPKPDPDVYLKAIEVSKIKNDETIIIEDSMIGVKAGVEANIKVIGITAGGHWEGRSPNLLLKSGAYAVARTFEEVIYIINKL